jgi:hypothetical protein
MTISITKTKLALSILVAALLVPATAWASHVFDDVPDDKFYAGPVEWAYDNNITTGKTATSFAPDDNVTRGESVTFLQRYNDNIVDPAINDLESDVADNATDIADLATDIAEMPSVYTARVDSDGSFLAGSSGTTSSRTSTGFYTVVFPVEISDCIWQATPTNDIGLFLFDADQVFVALQQGFTGAVADEDTIRVRMKDEDGAATNNRFDLVVHC